MSPPEMVGFSFWGARVCSTERNLKGTCTLPHERDIAKAACTNQMTETQQQLPKNFLLALGCIPRLTSIFKQEKNDSYLQRSYFVREHVTDKQRAVLICAGTALCLGKEQGAACRYRRGSDSKERPEQPEGDGR